MISAAIIHTPGRGRESLVSAVLEQLPHARVLEDMDGAGDYHIANRRGCWPMARCAWMAATGDHHIVLEDDAVLCADFAARLADVAAMAPQSVVSLFRGSRWCSVATLMPRSVIGRWLDWTEGECRIRPHHDQLIDIGCIQLGIEHLYADPSIVDHADVPSLLGHEHVRARRFDSNPAVITLVA